MAASLSDYEDKCVQLATDSAFYDGLRKRIEDSRANSPFWDPKVYASHLSDGFVAAWEHYLTGEPPKDIYVTGRPGTLPDDQRTGISAASRSELRSASSNRRGGW